MTTRLLFSLILLSLLAQGCGSPTRMAVLAPDGSPSFALMDFSAPPSLDPITPGWHHRTFRSRPPMDISFIKKDGRDSARLATNASASMLFRWVDVELDAYPILSWDWNITEPILTEADELTVSGDDHPARLYLSFESASGEAHSMEIIWGNQSLRRGDWKHLTFFGFFSFPHYTANGGEEQARKWHHERVRLSELYSTLWGDPAGARLVEVALFCDTDETGAKSVAYFSDIRVEVGP